MALYVSSGSIYPPPKKTVTRSPLHLHPSGFPLSCHLMHASSWLMPPAPPRHRFQSLRTPASDSPHARFWRTKMYSDPFNVLTTHASSPSPWSALHLGAWVPELVWYLQVLFRLPPVPLLRRCLHLNGETSMTRHATVATLVRSALHLAQWTPSDIVFRVAVHCVLLTLYALALLTRLLQRSAQRNAPLVFRFCLPPVPRAPWLSRA